jgi:hypothetical protein
MRSLALLVIWCACGDNNTTTLPPDMTMVGDMAFQSSCGFPGDQPVNEKGVGKFCEEILDCHKPGDPNWMVDLCSNLGDPTSHFCTFQCDPGVTDCGHDAVCTCNGLGCGCAPAKCAPKG